MGLLLYWVGGLWGDGGKVAFWSFFFVFCFNPVALGVGFILGVFWVFIVFFVYGLLSEFIGEFVGGFIGGFRWGMDGVWMVYWVLECFR